MVDFPDPDAHRIERGGARFRVAEAHVAQHNVGGAVGQFVLRPLRRLPGHLLLALADVLHDLAGEGSAGVDGGLHGLHARQRRDQPEAGNGKQSDGADGPGRTAGQIADAAQQREADDQCRLQHVARDLRNLDGSGAGIGGPGARGVDLLLHLARTVGQRNLFQRAERLVQRLRGPVGPFPVLAANGHGTRGNHLGQEQRHQAQVDHRDNGDYRLRHKEYDDDCGQSAELTEQGHRRHQHAGDGDSDADIHRPHDLRRVPS
jgi:hypothetical protein